MKTNKLMITCALCGGGTTRKQSPYVPLTPEELVADSLAAVRAGACILHIHVRDDEGANTMETSRFVQVVSMIREALRTNHLDGVNDRATRCTMRCRTRTPPLWWPRCSETRSVIIIVP